MRYRAANTSHLQRLLTAAVLLPAVVLIIVLGSSRILLLVVLVISGGGLLELAALLLSGSQRWFRLLVVGLGLLLPLATYWRGPAGLSAATTAVVFLVLGVHLVGYARSRALAPTLGVVLFAQLYVPFALSHILLVWRLPQGQRWLFLVLAVIFSGDTGAYYVGRQWGRHKLVAAVSPGKTIEGAVAGLVSSLVLALVAARVLLPGSRLVFIVILAAALALVGQIGDLMESMLKRASGVKDASGLLPGHGGLLDRLDSLLFAFPLAYYSVLFFA